MNTELEEEKESPEWKRIKEFVGGAKKASKHPLEQESDRLKQRMPEHFDEGGQVDNPLAPPPPISSEPFMPNGIPMPPIMPTAPVVQPSPVSAPNEATYDKQASGIFGGITPETIQRLMNTLNENGKKSQLGAGIAGIGDAIASVGGQNPGHMKNAEDLIQKNKEMGMKLPAEMAAVGKETYGLSHELQTNDPASPFSKMSQRTYGPDMLKMGLSQEQISRMPAALISDLFAKKVTLEEAKARIQQEGAYQQGMLKNTAQHQKEETQQGAAKALDDRGIVKRIMDSIPGTSGNASKKVLERQLEGDSHPDDEKAISWARANPNDPRSKKILSHNGM